MSISLTEAAAHLALVEHLGALRDVHLCALFENEPDRVSRLTFGLDDFRFDFSKQRVDARAVELLIALAEERGVPRAIEAMFAAEHINATEGRPALHVALRNRSNRPVRVEGRNVMPAVGASLAKMRGFVERLWTQKHVGHTGEAITDIVNIGIGGSDLGPRMVADALRPYWRDGDARALRRQRRRRRSRADASRARREQDVVHRSVEVVPHRRDVDQREERARVAGGRARRSGGRRQTLRRGLDEPRGREGIRDRPGPRLRDVGLGRRSLLVVVADRVADRGRDRDGSFRGAPRRRPPDG